MAQSNWKHWHCEKDENNIAWLAIDVRDKSTNVLSADVLGELDDILNHLAQSSPRGLVIYSGKDKGFIAGADVNEFTVFNDETEALQHIQRAHAIFNKLENLPFTTVAMIKGFCLGGGLEMSMTCRYRIADDDPATRLGFPEVKLGIHPGFGGTVRCIEVTGPMTGLDLMLSGRTLTARQAAKCGLITHAVPERHLKTAARSLIESPPSRKKPVWWQQLLNHARLRPLFAKLLVKKVSARAKRAHYPAPYALIDLWVNHMGDRQRMLQEEAASVAHLLLTKTAQNLVRVFHLQETCKALEADNAQAVRHIHVIGGGVMGGDIAAWCAYKGYKVTIQDQSHETLARVLNRAHKLYSKKLKLPRLVASTLDRLIPDFKGDGLKGADMVIEAIFEDADVKRELFRQIEPRLKDDTIIATNTSSIPLEQLAEALDKPERLVGLHFFNPVAKMPLVEIVCGEQTGQQAKDTAISVTKKIARLPLPVTSTPGFLVNRILMPYLTEAVTMAEEGIPLALIDQAAVDFGMPMGPIELADTVGLDICLKVADILSKSMPIEVSPLLQKLVDNHQLGKKTGKGFYTFRKGKPEKPVVDKDYKAPTDIQERLIMRLLNEAVQCQREKVTENDSLVDAGIIFGTGFAPFRGGPMHYIADRGAQQLLKSLQHMEKLYGPRFTPDEGWKSLEEK